MVTEHIQEGLDTIQEIKSYNQERDYLEKLDAKMCIRDSCDMKSQKTFSAFLVVYTF